ncbi:MAG: hypothetical protein JWN70_5125 [Planctomycetaceae bacterium]|nr:hypothetical protein [Planctomycetaceae bacterium]
MTEDKSLISLIPAEVQNKIYDDGLAKPVRVAGDIAEDVMKSFRLVMLPFQLMAVAQARVSQWLAEIEAKVPPERQVQAAPEIAGPVLENLRFISDDNKLKDLYLNLLLAAVDSEKRQNVHPGFVKVIERISADDAFVFWCIQGVDYASYSPQTYRAMNPFQSTKESFPGANIGRARRFNEPGTGDRLAVQALRSKLPQLSSHGDDQLKASLDLLESESLIKIDVEMGESGGSIHRLIVRVSTFGRAFANACLPDVFDTPA